MMPLLISTLLPYTTLFRSLRGSEQRHRLLFERNVAGVYRTTIDGRILECNAAMAGILGFSSREELMEQAAGDLRSEEHTSELQSRPHLVCRLLLEKKKI